MRAYSSMWSTKRCIEHSLRDSLVKIEAEERIIYVYEIDTDGNTWTLWSRKPMIESDQTLRGWSKYRIVIYLDHDEDGEYFTNRMNVEDFLDFGLPPYSIESDKALVAIWIGYYAEVRRGKGDAFEVWTNRNGCWDWELKTLRLDEAQKRLCELYDAAVDAAKAAKTA